MRLWVGASATAFEVQSTDLRSIVLNTEQVVEMIDAITEGRHTKIGWEGAALTDDLSLDFRKDSVRFTIRGEVFDVAHSRTAREIAGALVAWANRKEGSDIDLASVVKLFGDGTVEFPSVNDWAHIKSGRDTRENWYRRNVGRMTRETLERNMKDLREIKQTMSPSSEEWYDAQKAIDVLHDSLMGIKPPVEESHPEA